ncbi:MAG: hypothetical protein ACKOW9_02620 [Candidatus Paceibacterota bacterium]
MCIKKKKDTLLKKAIYLKVENYCKENDSISLITFLNLILLDRYNKLPKLEQTALKSLLVLTYILKIPFPSTLADRWLVTNCAAAALELNFSNLVRKNKR